MREEAAAATRDDREALLFDAVLHPNRSLGRAGFWLLMALVATLCAVNGTMFAIAGAWPVTVFSAIAAMLLHGAFVLSFRQARRVETLKLTRDNLTVRKVSPHGRVQAWHFQPYWLRVRLYCPPAGRGHLALSSHGRNLIVGSFLTADECAELAEALRHALRRCRGLPAANA